MVKISDNGVAAALTRARARVRKMEAVSDQQMIEEMRAWAAEIERDGHDDAAQLVRESANRLQLHLNSSK